MKTPTRTYTMEYLLRENNRLRTEVMLKNEKIAELTAEIAQLTRDIHG
jgi:hypothetical protein